MVIGLLQLSLYIADNASLKDKRNVIKSLKDKLRNNFNISVSEVRHNDVWQRAVLAVATVGTDRSYVNTLLNQVVKFVDNSGNAEILDSNIELL
jgi:hypothetical protein